MKVKVAGLIFDSEELPIVLLFESDEDRILVAGQIANMPPQTGKRAYVQYPNSKYTPEEIQGIVQPLL